MSIDPVLKVEHDAGVLTLTLDRPAARNALNLALTRALTAQLAAFDTDPVLKVMILTGTDPVFCAGLDLKDFSDPASPRAEVAALLNGVPRIRKPTIAAINGAAMTGGLELALGCDFMIASERARFGDTHTRIGALAGSGMSSRLPHAVGYRFAKQMSFTCHPIDAAAALRVGLVNEIVPHDTLLSRALEIARAIAAHDPELLATVKSVLDRGAETTLADSIRLEQEALAARKARGGMAWKS
jgi:enoyl-CoA hydratase